MIALIAPLFIALEPIQKVGTCPTGWYTSGSYCIPSTKTSPPLIQKDSTCPLGWYTSSDYCQKST